MIVRSSPLSDSGPNSPVGNDEITPTEVTRALSDLNVILAKAETRVNKVSSMREQQAGFVANQEIVLAQLHAEAERLDEEVCQLTKNLQNTEYEIARFRGVGPIRSEGQVVFLSVG